MHPDVHNGHDFWEMEKGKTNSAKISKARYKHNFLCENQIQKGTMNLRKSLIDLPRETVVLLD